MKYIDIHTHNKGSDENISILNLFPERVPDIEENGLYSIGLHPWYINESRVETDLHIIDTAAINDNILAVGETGLDKFAKAPRNLQKYIFGKQVKISEKYRKPLIIHCVGMFNELIRIKKEHSAASVWIIHGFNSNLQIARELIKNGFYLSFGQALLNNRSNAAGILPKIPLDRIFFETDDSGIDIEKIYNIAAFVLGMRVEDLCKETENSFNKIFKRS